jgi:nucleotide-binding universal stress UspA family protein
VADAQVGVATMYRSLLVHVEPTEHGRARLRIAVAAAKSFGARLIGVGAHALNPMPDPTGLSVLKLKQMIDEHLATAERFLKEEAGSAGLSSWEWRRETDFPTLALLRHACETDLIIAACNIEGNPPETQAGTADLIMTAGVPVLAVPSGVQLDLRRILIGWKDTRETRRAVWDALPLLKQAEHVRIVRFSPDPAPEIEHVVKRLRLHDVSVQGDVIQRMASSVADDIVAAADALEAGLIVAGGYGHSRVREWVLGGVTQGLLRRSSKPVLFSH